MDKGINRYIGFYEKENIQGVIDYIVELSARAHEEATRIDIYEDMPQTDNEWFQKGMDYIAKRVKEKSKQFFEEKI